MDIGNHHLWWLGRNARMERLIMNQPAFPLHNHGAQTLGMHLSGMTLRDYFAAKAMQTLVSKHSHEGDVSRNAYKIADAMLKARQA
jgi:hypothetical protein